MHTEGNEVHTDGDEARAGSTPNIVRWVLIISLFAAIVLLSAIWIFGAASTDDEDSVANVTDRMQNAEDDGTATDSIVSGDDTFTLDDSEGDTPLAEPVNQGDEGEQAP